MCSCFADIKAATTLHLERFSHPLVSLPVVVAALCSRRIKFATPIHNDNNDNGTNGDVTNVSASAGSSGNLPAYAKVTQDNYERRVEARIRGARHINNLDVSFAEAVLVQRVLSLSALALGLARFCGYIGQDRFDPHHLLLRVE